MKKTQAQVWAIVEALKKLYPEGICSLEYKKDYELLFRSVWRPSVPMSGSTR